MRIKILLLALLFVYSKVLPAQACCKIFFTYKALLNDSLKKISKIGLPTTRLFVGYISKKNTTAFQIKDVKSNLINDTLISHLSSDFCREPDSIIKYAFKGKNKNYTILIFKKGEKIPVEKKILIKDIIFTPRKLNTFNLIEIDLGEIKID